MSETTDIQKKTGVLFGDLWHRYDDKLFEESVALFSKRFEANGFDLSWFKGKKCLDAGCGGGRYTIAMAKLGAAEVIGCDISSEGLVDARRHSAGMSNILFEQASVLDLPYPDESFDFVCCSGVLHHTINPEAGLQELTRVLRPNGKIFLLLYGTGGLRWPTIMAIRPYAQLIGYKLLDEALHLAGLPANKQRTFLDDFFVPVIRFYDWEQVLEMMTQNGFSKVDRWQKGKLDHEESVTVQHTELEQLAELFKTMLKQTDHRFVKIAPHATGALEAITAVLDELAQIQTFFAKGLLNEETQKWRIFGWGHHRVLGTKD